MARHGDRGGRGDRLPREDRRSSRDETQSAAAKSEETTLTARERRIAKDTRRDRVRSVLRAVSRQYGYHIFENLMTEESGAIDFLAAGPIGAIVLSVRDEEGVVSVAEDGQLLIDRRSFEDDPRRQVNELADDVVARIPKADGAAHTQICFTRADVEYPDDLETMRGVCTVWTLAWPFGDQGGKELTPADAAEIAEEVEHVYGRPPFARPAGTGH